MSGSKKDCKYTGYYFKPFANCDRSEIYANLNEYTRQVCECSFEMGFVIKIRLSDFTKLKRISIEYTR